MRPVLRQIVHAHVLTIEQFVAIRFNVAIEVLTYEQAQELMSGPEWTGGDIV